MVRLLLCAMQVLLALSQVPFVLVGLAITLHNGQDVFIECDAGSVGGEHGTGYEDGGKKEAHQRRTPFPRRLAQFGL